ncbi:MAG TPA: hypothetical protein VNT75_00705 [Symbiobacteriaceae bacterium]|nr:hypothetical protein [Symbiobacteriaceae bacterium]
MGWIILALVLVVAVVVGYNAAEEKDEEMLVLKLFGYSVLGFLTLRLNGFPLPLGFVIALIMANRAPVNQRARRYAALVTFVWWIVSLFIF